MIRRIRFVPLLALLASLCLPTTASAIPFLQLGIGGGIYDFGDETSVSITPTFTLYAYLTPGNNTTAAELQHYLNTTYYIAAALTPKVHQAADLGSFSFNGTTVNATSDMVYGVPPFEPHDHGQQDDDPGDLADHGVYDTYFKEFAFKFKSGASNLPPNCALIGGNVNCTTPINTQDSPSHIPTPTVNGTQYYMAFEVDVTDLSPGYEVHFDLYSEKYKNGDYDIKNFAPFSHDAASAAPEPSTIALFGAGALVLAARHRRRSR